MDGSNLSVLMADVKNKRRSESGKKWFDKLNVMINGLYVGIYSDDAVMFFDIGHGAEYIKPCCKLG